MEHLSILARFMRVTANTFPHALLNQLTQLTTRQNRLQTQAATGQKIQYPEDDPVAIRRVLDMQAEGKTINQYQRNIDRLEELSNATHGSLKSLKGLLSRAEEIATLADELKNPEELRTYSVEVNELIKQATYLVNVQNRGDSLFAGTRTDQPAFAMDLDNDGRVQTVTYQGNTQLPEVEISENTTLTAQFVGANTSGSGPHGLVADTRFGADLFNHLISLRDRLAAGDAQSITNQSLQDLAADEELLLFHLGTVGAIQTRLETASEIIRQRDFSLESLVSNEADADITQTLVRLSQTQTAYQAALQSGGTILNTSLLDYLR